MAVAVLLVAGCGRSDTPSAGASVTPSGTDQNLSGRIEVDGSSTVGPFVTAGAEDFQQQNSGVQVTVGISGTGGGFERFCAGETDISDASRPIKEDECRCARRTASNTRSSRSRTTASPSS
jgi:phosphate transport system substrate-binding protein